MDKLGKRLLVVVLALILAITLFGCGTSGGYTPSNTPGNGTANYEDGGGTANVTDSPRGVEAPWMGPAGNDNTKLASRFNLFSGGYAAAAGNWILFNNPDDNGYLYRMNANGSESTLLCAVPNVGEICVSGQMVYFSSLWGNQIYSYDMRENVQAVLLGESGTMLQYHDGYVYFMQGGVVAGQGKLYRVPADGSRTPTGGYDKQEIYNENFIGGFTIHPGESKIYFIIPGYHVGLFQSMDMNGGNVQRVVADDFRYSAWDYTNRMAVNAYDNDILFFQDYNQTFDWYGYFFAIEKFPWRCAWNYLNGYVVYEDGKGVYLINTNDYAGLSVPAGTGEKILTSSDVSAICIVNGWAFCYQVDPWRGVTTGLHMFQRPELA